MRRVLIAIVVVIAILAIIGMWFVGQQGFLPWQPEPTRIPITPFADLPGSVATPAP